MTNEVLSVSKGKSQLKNELRFSLLLYTQILCCNFTSTNLQL